MGKTPKKKGRGRVVTSAPSASGSRKSLALAVAKANAESAGKRVRPFMNADGLVDWLDALTVKIPASVWNKAQTLGTTARAAMLREWCETHGMDGLVSAYDDGFCTRRSDKCPESVSEWRPANNVRERIHSLPSPWCEKFGYVSAEIAPVQLARVQSLKWTKGQPEHFEGADGVFIFRLP